MLKARNVERNFQVYPPYWYYRAKAAQEIKDNAETLKCYDKLRYDPYKLEAEKYRVQALAAKENPDTAEIRKHLEIIRDYTQDGDWSNNLFAGVAYFLLGDKDEGIACVEPNVDFDYEKEISERVLAQMEKGKLDLVIIQDMARALQLQLVSLARAVDIISHMRDMQTAALAWYADNLDTAYATGFKIATLDKKEIFKYLGTNSVDVKYSFVNGQTTDTEWYVKCDLDDAQVAEALNSCRTIVGLRLLTSPVSTDTSAITKDTEVYMFIR